MAEEIKGSLGKLILSTGQYGRLTIEQRWLDQQPGEVDQHFTKALKKLEQIEKISQ